MPRFKKVAGKIGHRPTGIYSRYIPCAGTHMRDRCHWIRMAQRVSKKPTPLCQLVPPERVRRIPVAGVWRRTCVSRCRSSTACAAARTQAKLRSGGCRGSDIWTGRASIPPLLISPRRREPALPPARQVKLQDLSLKKDDKNREADQKSTGHGREDLHETRPVAYVRLLHRQV